MALTTLFDQPGKLGACLRLMRVDRPIGTYLLLWPTLMALLLATEGWPDLKNVLIFIAGTFLMRSAGCVINDFADRDFDGDVERTEGRPLATGELQASDALKLAAGLSVLAFGLVLLTNIQTILLSLAAVMVAALYPFMKRVTQWPQLVLGIAFSFGIPMAFTAEGAPLTQIVWLLFATNVLWTIAFDTFYAMVDREDDLRIGIKSTAILFGRYDRLITTALQVVVIGLLLALAEIAHLHWPFYVGVGVSALMFIYQQRLLASRVSANYFKAFLHNHWVGACWFVSLVVERVLF